MPTGTDQQVLEEHAASVGAGLDALDAPPSVVRRTTGGRVRRVATAALPPVVAIVVGIAVWQALWAAALWPEYQLPSPATVGSHVVEAVRDGKLLGWFWTSVHRAFIGFGISLLVAVPLGLAMANIRVVRRAIGQVPPILPRVGKVLGAGRLATVRHILLPAALPGFLGGLKQGWAFSWRSLMAAELIATSPDLGEGLGQVLHNGMSLSDQSLVFFAIFLIFLVGVGIELAVFRPLERSVLRARGLTTALR
jgi:NitT/TauT family transport system permease protein